MSRKLAWLRHNFRYLLAYLVLMALLLFIIYAPEDSRLKQLDSRMIGYLNCWAEQPELSNDIVIIDVPYDQNKATYRRTVGTLLSVLARNQPRAVIMDIAFESNPEGLDAIKQGIQSLQSLSAQHILVYAAIDPRDENSPQQLDPNYLKRHAQELYLNLLDGFGHTLMEEWGKGNCAMLLKYNPFIMLGPTELPALVVKVVEDVNGKPWPSNRNKPILIYLGDHVEAMGRTFTFKVDQQNLEQGIFVPFDSGDSRQTPAAPIKPEFTYKFILIGSLKKDVHATTQRPGPELLAWALSARIALADRTTELAVLEGPLTLLSILLGYSAITWLGFFKLFHIFRHSRWRLALATLGCVVVSIILLVLMEKLFIGLDHLYPQLSPVVVDILIVVGVARWQSGETLRSEASEKIFFDKKGQDHLASQGGDKQRLRQKIAQLQQDWQLCSQRLDLLSKDHIVETRSEEKFRLEHLIAKQRDECDQVEKELQGLEKQLSAIEQGNVS